MDLKLSTLRHLSQGDQDEALGKLVSEAKRPPNGQMTTLGYDIKAYEHRFKMSSAELLDGLSKGTIEENEHISKWLFLLQTQKLLRG